MFVPEGVRSELVEVESVQLESFSRGKELLGEVSGGLCGAGFFRAAGFGAVDGYPACSPADAARCHGVLLCWGRVTWCVLTILGGGW